MQIRRVRLFRQWQPFRDGTYATSGGSAEGFDSLVVAVDCDGDVTGWGEMAPLGSFYSPAFAAGARAGAEEVAAALIGLDAAAWRVVEARLDTALNGHPYVKSALDMACRDASARASGRPLCDELGGRFGGDVRLYRSISPAAPQQMAERAVELEAAGYGRLQVKVGGDPGADAERVDAVAAAVGPGVSLVADANGGFTTQGALEFLRLAPHSEFLVEQPCASFEECAVVRAHCDRPLALDESIDSTAALLRARGVADAVTLKLSRVGGVSRAARMRDLACELGMRVTVEDTGGSTIDTAAMAHLSASTPEPHRGHTVDFNNWVTVENATGLPQPQGGVQPLPTGPGLGIEVLEDALGRPLAVIE
jgi:L-alanine-DL-glutamate epimerase-like enolase superfamily enzyme